MMARFSLRWKFILAIAAGTVMSATLVAAGFSWRDWSRYWEHTTAEISAVANIVSSQLGAAVMLSDERAAAEVVGSLRGDSRIRSATVYGAGKGCFASFTRKMSQGCPPRPEDGIYRDHDALVVTRPITAGDDRIGTLSVIADVPPIREIVFGYLKGATLIVLLSLIVSVAVAILLQTRVSGPILAITGVVREITETRQFGKRVDVSSSDEVGALATSFNLMLDQIEERDAELARRREQLEHEVVERTHVNEELQRAKERAESAARIKTEFLANMSHEIRTPINGVSGMIALALANCKDQEVQDQLTSAQVAAGSLISIVNDILDFSKIEAGKMTLDLVDFDLGKAVDECVQLLKPAAQGKGLDLGFTFDEDCPRWLKGDPHRLRQILVNLVGNAVKFTVSGSVHVRMKSAKAGVILFEVADTGIGIPADKIATIFSAFTQADGSHSRRFGGSGLGLTITNRLVTLMGGEVWVESEPGRGTSFFVSLPLPSGSELKTIDTSGSSYSDLPIREVLVAEDNKINQKVVCGLLRRQNWNVTLVDDGTKAYEAFLNGRFDLILMDVQMPGLDGLQATALIREQERRSARKPTPIIALTAHALQAQHAECIAHGMDAVVVKPLQMPALLECIAGVLKSKQPDSAGCAAT